MMGGEKTGNLMWIGEIRSLSVCDPQSLGFRFKPFRVSRAKGLPSYCFKGGALFARPQNSPFRQEVGCIE